MEAIITQDIGQRGLAVDPADNLVTRCRGNLERAARHLAREGRAVAIVTGFYVAGERGPTIETDGPCGAIALAWLFAEQSFTVTMVTDPLGAGVVEAGLHAAPIRTAAVSLTVFPFENDDPRSVERGSNWLRDSQRSQEFVERFFRWGTGSQLSHLIAVERAGPSHLTPSHVGHSTADETDVGLDHENQVHNFRGEIITPYTAKTHLLFDFIRKNRLPIHTIGIGDGGNEIGMGSIPRAVVHANIRGGRGDRIACRVPTDWTIACGVSNWGAYALGTAVACLRGRAELLNEWTDARERAVLEALVRAGAVDGVTGRPDHSVDGMPVEQHLTVWDAIREAVVCIGSMRS